MDLIADCLRCFSNFKQLELYAQKQHNKKASIEIINDKKIKDNKIKIKKFSTRFNKNNNNDFVNIEYKDGSSIVGKTMW